MDIGLWIGFAIGLLARWGDRIQFVLSENGDGKTLGGYFRANGVRLLIRALVGGYCFHLMVASGGITSSFVSFSTGVSFDVILESFLDRAKRGGETVVAKLKNGTGA
jgi:hypothetical protein